MFKVLLRFEKKNPESSSEARMRFSNLHSLKTASYSISTKAFSVQNVAKIVPGDFLVLQSSETFQKFTLDI